MPVDTGAQLIVDDILKEAASKASSIARAAKKEAETILDATRFDNKEEEASEQKVAQVQGKRLHDEITSEGRTRARRELLHKREELIETILKDAQKELQDYAASDKYARELASLAIAACKKLDANQVVIQASRRDLKLLEKSKAQILKELGGSEKGASVSFSDPIQTSGGVRVAEQDGKVEIDETFDGKLAREMDSLRVKVAKVLFEGSK